jgi:RimJ/RimL family protein N-acetyltransferase
VKRIVPELLAISLTGEFVSLEPMRPEHGQGILDASRDFDWAWITVKLENLESTRKWIANALEAEARGEDYPFVVRENATEKIIGCTRYMDTHPKQRATEIGWTWYSPSTWGTIVNPECKLLLLAHAFDD